MPHQATELLGSIVAFEGLQDTISTQLRLLPTSPQVLILPSVQCRLPADLEHDFDARVYVRHVHDALMARNKTARAFLQGSTPTDKRLVFMNGGTPSAQALCIRAIMEHETGGDEAQAGAIFDDLIKDGLAGLLANPRSKSNAFSFPSSEDEQEGDFQDPITRAMRAADALDRQTANLQPSNDLDLTAPKRQRSSSLPLYGYSDALGDAAPFFVFGARPAERESQVDDGLVSPKTISVAVMQSDEPLQKPTHLGPANSTSVPYSPSCIGETYEPNRVPDPTEAEPSSPTSDVFSIRTQENIVYGEASFLDVRLSISNKGSLARVKSLDRIYPASPMFRDLGIPSQSWLAEPETPRPLRPKSLMVVRDERDAALSRLNGAERPRTIVVMSKAPIVKVDPVPQDRKKNKKHVKAKSTYVDRGTDPDADVDHESALFQPLFTCAEDLVVFIKEGTPDGLLDSAISAFKNGRYPLPALSTRSREPEETDRSARGTSNAPSKAPENAATASEEPLSACVPADADDYDPFAYTQPAPRSRKPSQIAPKMSIVGPPTPAQTPPPSVAAVNEHKFHEFTIAPNQTAVAVQNSLRSILAEYFPPDTQGYHQFQFSMLPEFDGLWKPIFRATEPDSQQKGECKLHQVLAIGSQQGVKKEYSLAITGQLERLGSKSSELGRADRVDFRYLLANAMQAFTAQPLANQTSDNPFTNSYLLATLIVPHLETYLALHPEVRYLLLQYPPEHLGTVLALQKLVGVDLMKVAQIVDSNSKENLPFTHIRGASIGSKSEATPAKRSSPSPRSSSDVPVNKANFLLTSTASDKDIAKFVSTVWNIPADLFDSDVLEPSAQKASDRKARPSPLLMGKESLSPLSKASPQSPVSPKTVIPSPPTSEVPSSTRRPPSVAESAATSRSAKSRQSRGKSRGNAPPQTDNASIMSLDPGDDSDYDAEARRLMPLFLRRTATRKPNSRKALKFLGLA